MKLELRNIKLGFGSEETLNFLADLYADGKKIAYCENTGKGGQTNINPFPPYKWTEIQAAEAYARTLPPFITEFSTHEMTLEHWVDEEAGKFADQKETEKAMKKMAKECEKMIIIWNESQGAYRFVKWKSHTLAQLIAMGGKGHDVIRKELVRIVASLTPGEVIYNTNLTEFMPSSPVKA